jgi:hypothetical protein
LRGSERAADILLRHTNSGEQAPAKIHIWLPDAIPAPEVLEGYVVRKSDGFEVAHPETMKYPAPRPTDE